jgi:hypothetical protein
MVMYEFINIEEELLRLNEETMKLAIMKAGRLYDDAIEQLGCYSLAAWKYYKEGKRSMNFTDYLRYLELSHGQLLLACDGLEFLGKDRRIGRDGIAYALERAMRVEKIMKSLLWNLV